MNNITVGNELKIIELKDKKLPRVKCEIWTRVMGYHRPVSNFNKGKKAEFHDRKFFFENTKFNDDFK